MALPDIPVFHYQNFATTDEAQLERMRQVLCPGDRVFFFDVDDTLFKGDVLKMALKMVVEKLCPDLGFDPDASNTVADRLLTMIIAYQNSVSHPLENAPADFYAGKQKSKPGDSSAIGTLFLHAAGITSGDLIKIFDQLEEIPGMREMMSDLAQDGIKIGLLSSAYQPVVTHIAKMLGFDSRLAVGTTFKDSERVSPSEQELVKALIWEIRNLDPEIFTKKASPDQKKQLVSLFESYIRLLELTPGGTLAQHGTSFQGMGGEYKAYVLREAISIVGQPELVGFGGDGRTDIVAAWMLAQLSGCVVAFYAIEAVKENANIIVPRSESQAHETAQRLYAGAQIKAFMRGEYLSKDQKNQVTPSKD